MSIDAPAASESTTHVLVVDCDATESAPLVEALSAAGYEWRAVSSPSAQEVEPAPAIAIVSLAAKPARAALDVIDHLKRAHGAAVHIVALAARGDEAGQAAAFDAGSDDVVVRPAVMSDLMRRIAAAIRNRRALVEALVAREVADRRMAYGAEAGALLAHDLNNGLAVALLNVQFLRDALTLDEDQAEAFDATLKSLRRMSSLVTNFVDIARFEEAGITPPAEPIALAPLLAAVLEVSATALAPGVTQEVSCEPELTGRFDLALVERVLHNLVGNAARYCTPGGTLSVVARRWGDGGVELAVTNAGPQIPEPVRAHLFERRVRGSGGKRGMGLYFCRLVIEAHGGTVHHEATPMGPRFVLRLPGPS